jgi:hypothetical protein
VKKTVSISILALACTLFASSCKKEYQCYCNINYVYKGKVVNTTTSNNTITTKLREDADRQCKYYEEEVDYLNQKTTIQHYCGIK